MQHRAEGRCGGSPPLAAYRSPSPPANGAEVRARPPPSPPAGDDGARLAPATPSQPSAQASPARASPDLYAELSPAPLSPLFCGAPPPAHPHHGHAVTPPRASALHAQPTLRDLLTRLRFSSAFAATYLSAMLLAAGLILCAAVTDTMNTLWYQSLEVLLTLLFAGEVSVRWYLQGTDHFLSKRLNVAEVCLLGTCTVILIFPIVLGGRTSRAEEAFEAMLLSVRYAAQCGRFYFFLRSAALEWSEVDMHMNVLATDNANAEQFRRDPASALGPRTLSGLRNATSPDPEKHALSAPAHLHLDDESDDAASDGSLRPP